MSSNPLDVGCLRLFEAVARHRNLSRAAAALGTTQPALSYRIRRMEELLGVALFRRGHRGLTPTPEGEVLQQAVRQGLERLDEAVRSIRRRAPSPAVRLVTDFAFAAFRLMPRMADFRRAHPEIDVHIVATQARQAEVESDAELAVLFGSRDDFAGEALLLIPERVTTVCAPGFLRRHGPFERPEQLLQAPLIHLEGDGSARWFTWDSWLAAAGVEDRRPARSSPARSSSVNTYTLAIQAVQAEQGVALGWYGLVDELLAAGALVQACPTTLTSGRGYWLLRRRPAPSPEADRVARWLLGS